MNELCYIPTSGYTSVIKREGTVVVQNNMDEPEVLVMGNRSQTRVDTA